MAIQMRRGLLADLDKSKLVAGEIVVALDNNKDYIGVAKAPSNVVELASKTYVDDSFNPTVTGETLILKS